MARIINTADLLETSALDHNAKEWIYNGLDCCVTLEIRDNLKAQLDDTTRRTYEFSKALQGPVLEMGMRGILVDNDQRQKVLKSFTRQVDQLASQLDELARDGVGFDISPAKTGGLWWRSPVRLKNLFYDVMGVPAVRKRNANGLYSPTVDRDALERISEYFLAEPLARHLILLREIDKKRSWLRTDIDSDGRMRSNFNIAGTNTGRLSSSYSDFGTGGNLQNVDRELRSVFVADKGWKFGNLDLEQGDSRNVGAICWELFVDSHGEQFAGSYLDACESGDLHTFVCRMSRPDLAWTGDLKADRAIAEQIAYRQDTYRQLAKKLGHGTNYYGAPRTMAKHSKVATHVIEEFQHNYFQAFPVIGSTDRKDTTTLHWHNYVRNSLRDVHSLTSLLGRRRNFFGRANEDSTLREAIAYEPQSMTADEIDTGLLRLWRSKRVQVLVQVHDSILFQYPEEEEDEIIPWAIKTLQVELALKKGRKFFVPVDAKVGWNWGEIDERGDNPDGLIKWKGHDDRKRLAQPRPAKRLSFDSLV
jgi:DNA polymerase I-like protein with 3'-5' exonuclease and polymerase domains